MKKILFSIVLLFLFSSFQPNWLTKTKQNVDEINNSTTLIKEIENKHEDGKERIALFMDNSASLIQYTQDFEEYYSFTKSYYKKDNIIIAEITYGLIPILYKKKRKKEEPLGYVLHEVKYFKNKKKGIKKSKSILYFGNEDIEGLKALLVHQKHIESELEDTAYLESESHYNQLLQNF